MCSRAKPEMANAERVRAILGKRPQWKPFRSAEKPSWNCPHTGDPNSADRRIVGNLCDRGPCFLVWRLIPWWNLSKGHPHRRIQRATPPRRRFWIVATVAQRNLSICIFRPMRLPNGFYGI